MSAITKPSWSSLFPFENLRRRSLKDAFSSTIDQINANSAELTVGPGAGITDGVGTVAKTSVVDSGGIVTTRFLLDLTGLSSSTTLNDIIGVGTSPAYIGQMGTDTALSVRMTCLEAPAGGVADIDLWSATEGTGVFDGDVTALTETILVASTAVWTLGRVVVGSGVPASGNYLYLTSGVTGTAAAYTAGKFLIEVMSY